MVQFDSLRIQASNTKFTGIILSMEAQCMMRVTLDVVFGTPDNYHIEAFNFDIVPFRSGYHGLLGLTTCAQFHVAPHYGYMKLKVSVPKDVIAICGNAERSLQTKDHTTAYVAKAQGEASAAKQLAEMKAAYAK